MEHSTRAQCSSRRTTYTTLSSFYRHSSCIVLSCRGVLRSILISAERVHYKWYNKLYIPHEQLVTIAVSPHPGLQILSVYIYVYTCMCAFINTHAHTNFPIVTKWNPTPTPILCGEMGRLTFGHLSIISFNNQGAGKWSQGGQQLTVSPWQQLHGSS